jgi:hypothetical protein
VARSAKTTTYENVQQKNPVEPNYAGYKPGSAPKGDRKLLLARLAGVLRLLARLLTAALLTWLLLAGGLLVLLTLLLIVLAVLRILVRVRHFRLPRWGKTEHLEASYESPLYNCDYSNKNKFMTEQNRQWLTSFEDRHRAGLSNRTT